LAYKLYAAVLAERLGKETEEKSVSKSQAGFRKDRSTIDNIYILQHVID